MVEPSSLVRPELLSIADYNAGLTLEEVRARHQVETIAKLGSNENPFGPTAGLGIQIGEIGDLARLYPDPQGRALGGKLADHFGIGSDHIILGNGSEDLIAVICRSVVRPGDTVATLYPSFPLHEDYTVLMGGKVDRVTITPELTIDLAALLDALRRKPRMVIFANPMNPVGCWLTPAELEAVISALDDETLLVVDEAYAEYAAGDDYPSAVDMLLQSKKNWVVLRTFSKAYGLAGLRIGYGVVGSRELASFFNRARTPFNTNAIAQASAVAALADEEHLRRSVVHALAERERVRARLQQLGYEVAPSKGNFLFFDTRTNASNFAEKLLRRGVVVKPWKQDGYQTFVRVSIGSVAECDQFLDALMTLTPDPDTTPPCS